MDLISSYFGGCIPVNKYVASWRSISYRACKLLRDRQRPPLFLLIHHSREVGCIVKELPLECFIRLPMGINEKVNKRMIFLSLVFREDHGPVIPLSTLLATGLLCI